MSTDPFNEHEAVRISAVRRDESSAALRKIARACIAIARQQIKDEQAHRPSDASPTPRPDSEEDDHA
ncbi:MULTISPECIES: hypothetical protein [Nocardiaceae]|uniref:Uncharacterized protein n=1 Tax=Rhodococcoides corynebacterioides TaxID=53972 RepID=A0ABS2KY26_9NOCA|nr:MULTISPECIES: hypothetical protein [Rhodococcus]MBM7416832.1 hypothetical protein [Rhodococcus corynebacterioides]MBP1115085.1 hypothetical protein [Rhodococcus sp. PvP016]